MYIQIKQRAQMSVTRPTLSAYRRLPTSRHLHRLSLGTRLHEVLAGIPGVSLGTAPAKILVFVPKSDAARRRLGKELWVCENGL